MTPVLRHCQRSQRLCMGPPRGFASYARYIRIQLVTSLSVSDIQEIHPLPRMHFMPYRFGPAILTTSLKEIAMKLIQGSFTKRALIVGLIAGGGILAASSYAMSDGDSAGKAGCEGRHGQQHHGEFNRTKWEEKRAEHLSVLKDKLKLKPGQEAAWNAFANSAKPGMGHDDGDRRAMRGEFEKLNTPQRLDKMLAMSELRRAKMLERTQAVKTFYAQLTPEQQTVFDAEAMPDRHREQHQHRVQS
jgi:protein CpxP